MTWDDNVKMINDYNEWVARKKASNGDYSASAYMTEVAKDEALKQVIAVEDILREPQAPMLKLRKLYSLFAMDSDVSDVEEHSSS